MVSDQTVKNLAETFERTSGGLADRLMAALKAGQAGGGDKRGMQSAALLVVRKNGGYLGRQRPLHRHPGLRRGGPDRRAGAAAGPAQAALLPQRARRTCPDHAGHRRQLEPILLSEPAGQTREVARASGRARATPAVPRGAARTSCTGRTTTCGCGWTGRSIAWCWTTFSRNERVRGSAYALRQRSWPQSRTPPASAGIVRDTRFFGHPRGLSTLFFTEMWERFSYYGMRALLILFMTAPVAAGGLGFDTAKAGADLRHSTSRSSTHVAAGRLARRPLAGPAPSHALRRRAHHARAHLSGGPVAHDLLLGLGPGRRLGTGLLKPNISTMVGELYTPDDERRDAGFSLYYMGINTGAFIAPLVCGWFAQSEQFQRDSRLARDRARELLALGLRRRRGGHVPGPGAVLAGWKHLGTAGMYPAPPTRVAAAAGTAATAAASGVARRRLALPSSRALALAGIVQDHGTGREQRARHSCF